jgi:hypothetical protein
MAAHELLAYDSVLSQAASESAPPRVILLAQIAEVVAKIMQAEIPEPPKTPKIAAPSRGHGRLARNPSCS